MFPEVPGSVLPVGRFPVRPHSLLCRLAIPLCDKPLMQIAIGKLSVCTLSHAQVIFSLYSEWGQPFLLPFGGHAAEVLAWLIS